MERSSEIHRDMTADPTKPPENRFHQMESPSDEPPPRGMNPVWITLAIILILEIAGMVWFYRICTRPSQPKDGQPPPAPIAAPPR
jgi:hypothetical protein